MSALTRKHFQRVAGILRRTRHTVCIDSDVDDNDPELLALRSVAEQLADYFAEENPNFDRKRFLEACGVNHEQA